MGRIILVYKNLLVTVTYKLLETIGVEWSFEKSSIAKFETNSWNLGSLLTTMLKSHSHNSSS